MNKSNIRSYEWGDSCVHCNFAFDADYSREKRIIITKISTTSTCFRFQLHEGCFMHLIGEEYYPRYISGYIHEYHCYRCYDPVMAGEDHVEIGREKFFASTANGAMSFIVFHLKCFLELSGRGFFERYYKDF